MLPGVYGGLAPVTFIYFEFCLVDSGRTGFFASLIGLRWFYDNH